MQQNDVYKGATGDKPIIGENTFLITSPLLRQCVSVLPAILLHGVQTIVSQSSQSSQSSVVVTSFQGSSGTVTHLEYTKFS